MTDWQEIDPRDAPAWMVKRGMTLGPIPKWQREIIEDVLSDLQTEGSLSLRFAYERASKAQDRSAVLWAWEEGQEGAAGYGRDARGTTASRMVAFADWLQEQVIPESVAAWGEACPRCPGHTHPMTPLKTHGEAWWTCPEDDNRKIARIGELNRT